MFKNLSTRALGISALQSETLEAALSYNFRGIELDYDDFRAGVQSYGLEHGRRMLDSAKIKLGGFRLPFFLDSKEEHFKSSLDRLVADAAWISAIGCTRALVTIRPTSDTLPYHENFELHKNRLMKLADAVADSEIRIGVGFDSYQPLPHAEGFEFIRSLDALVALLGMVPRENVGLVVDLWSIHQSQGNLSQIKQFPGSKIIHVYVSDAKRELPPDKPLAASRTLPLETGVIDAAAALKLIASLGYDGPVTPAAYKGQFREESRDAIIRRAGEAMKQLWLATGLNPSPMAQEGN
jgi:sugar phosphate isomerase/epimerase